MESGRKVYSDFEIIHAIALIINPRITKHSTKNTKNVLGELCAFFFVCLVVRFRLKAGSENPVKMI
jgi:hypothetical protein